MAKNENDYESQLSSIEKQLEDIRRFL